MKINLQINKMIKMNKKGILICILSIVERPGVSWGVMGCPGVISLTRLALAKGCSIISEFLHHSESFRSQRRYPPGRFALFYM